VQGGQIFLSDSTTTVTICVDDDMEEPVTALFSQAPLGDNSVWVITDTALNILEIDTTNTFVLDGAGVGVCLIWHVSHDGSITGAAIGSNAGDLGGCFALSNSITVVREDGCGGPVCMAEGGSLTAADGATSVVVCGGDVSGESVAVELTGASGENNTWIITDTTGVIIGFPLAPPFNLSGARAGSYQIWHLSYDGTISGASLGANVGDISGCIAFSNPLTVQRIDVEASTISYADSSEVKDICVSGDITIDLGIEVSGGQGLLTTWVITDTSANILYLGEDVNEGVVNTGSGSSLVWLVNHADNLLASVGDNASDIRGCFALSNSLSVNTTEVSGGLLLTSIGTAEITICTDDGESNDFDLSLTGALGAASTFLITDTSGTVLQVSDDIDFSLADLEDGTCLLWHLSSSEDLEILTGSNASELEGCISLSNSVTITKVSGDSCPPPCPALGGMITTEDGDTEITICVDDDISDLFGLEVNGAEGDSSGFIVTDEEGNVLGINDIFEADLEGTGAGITLVRHISYNAGTTLPENGGNINELTGCFDLSNIFTIRRVIGPDCSDECISDGGTISLADDASDTFCTDDGEADIVNLIISGAIGQQSVLLLTNDDGEIVDIITSGSINLEGTGGGSLLVRHLSYSDTILNLVVGGSIDELEGCLDLSNTIEVTKEIGDECPGVCTTDGGIISAGDEAEDLQFCAGDVNFSISHTSAADTGATSYYYIITDEDDEVTEWRNALDGGDFNLSREPGGICRVYGYNTEDPSSLELGINVEDLEEGCGALSANFITIDKQTGGACDEGCHTPRDVRVSSSGRNRWSIKWDRVSEARSYTVLVGYEGVPGSFAEVPVRRNRIRLSGPADRVLVIQIRAECGFGESSPYTAEFRLDSNQGSSSFISTGRSAEIHHGTVLASGIVITEQAVAYPNPAIDQVTVWYDGDGIQGYLSLFNQTGQRVLTQQLDGQAEWHQLSIAELPAGLYMIAIQRDGMLIHQDKLIVADR